MQKQSVPFCLVWMLLSMCCRPGDDVNAIVQIASVAVMDVMGREEKA